MKSEKEKKEMNEVTHLPLKETTQQNKENQKKEATMRLLHFRGGPGTPSFWVKKEPGKSALSKNTPGYLKHDTKKII